MLKVDKPAAKQIHIDCLAMSTMLIHPGQLAQKLSNLNSISVPVRYSVNSGFSIGSFSTAKQLWGQLTPLMPVTAEDCQHTEVTVPWSRPSFNPLGVPKQGIRRTFVTV